MTAVVPATGVWFFPDRPAHELVSAIVHAEAAGLDEVWLGDEGPAREPFTVLAAAAQVTSRIKLGVGITNPYVRHPALAMASIATISELSNGRAILGVGAGGAMSLGPFQLTVDRPLADVERFLDIAHASCAGQPTDGYVPSDLAVARTAPPVPIFLGARGPRLNMLASKSADGAFVAGMPPFRYSEVLAWARSVRPIEISLYPSVAFDDVGRERHRPEMVWSLLDSPAEVLAEFGLQADQVQAAATSLREGDPGPASALITDELLRELMLIGEPDRIGMQLAELVVTHKPNSIGLAIVAPDLTVAIEQAGEAFETMRSILKEDSWSG
jgi:5,10-methylenetetrahydromethanopterin reductase